MATFIADLYSFSPNGLYLACLNHTERQILIRKCYTNKTHIDNNIKANNNFNESRFKVEQVIQINTLKNGSSSLSRSGPMPIDNLVWSPDSSFLATSSKKYAVISVFSVLDSSWKCTINLGEDLHGLESFMWGKDARHLICVSGDISFLSVWSIRSKQVDYIKDICPIPKCAGLSYSPSGSHLAVAHISSTYTPTQPYYICIYSTNPYSKSPWQHSSKFAVISKDLDGISWCPGEPSEYLCIWDSNLFSNLYIYSTRSGALIKHYSPYGMTSSGFNSVKWAGSGHFLACTAQNKNELHVLNGLTFGVLIHDVLEPERNRDSGIMGRYEIFYEANKIPRLGMNKYERLTKWPHISLDSDSLLKLQVHLKSPPSSTNIKISPDGSHLACTTLFYPQVLWTYDLISTVSPVAVLIHQHPIIDFDWNPSSHLTPTPSQKLAIICKSPESSRGVLYFWMSAPTEKGGGSTTAYIHNTSAKFSFSGVEWSPQGDVLLIRDNSQKIHLLCSL